MHAYSKKDLQALCLLMHNASMNEETPPITGRAKGGLARAQALSPAERKEIARRAAEARWGSEILTATHAGEVRLGDVSLDCAVLGDGRRVLSTRGVDRALGRKAGGYDYRRKTKDAG